MAGSATGYVAAVDEVDDLLATFEPVSLDGLDRHASLQRRVDTKYLITRDALEEIRERIPDAYRALEIEGRRVFEYESVYFDTPELRCLHDQIAGRRPRYKARTRYYRTTGTCMFEVKLKREDGETDKRSISYDAERRRELTADARDLIDDALSSAGLGEPPYGLRPSLVTSFRRATLAAAEPAERATIDFDVRLAVPRGDALQFSDRCALIECKSPAGGGVLDRLLSDAGHEPISLSKYRLGVGRLQQEETDPRYADEARATLTREHA